MSYSYGKKSRQQLDTCDPRLIEIFEEAIKYVDITIIQGHRTPKQHAGYLASGATKVPYEKTMHRFNPSKAIDAAPWPIPGGASWGAKWKDRVKFYELAAIIRLIAAQKGIKIRWGGDWDGDYDYWDQTFDDLVHFELVD